MKKGMLILCILLIVGSGCSLKNASSKDSDCDFKNAQHITTKSLIANAIKKVVPSIPSGFGRIDTKIDVKVIIDPSGKVTCARAAEKSHPILGKICEEAANQWLFKPFQKNDQQITVTGVINFHIKH